LSFVLRKKKEFINPKNQTIKKYLLRNYFELLN
jgi:hypothetical protein